MTAAAGHAASASSSGWASWGLRVNHALNVHVFTLTVTPK